MIEAKAEDSSLSSFSDFWESLFRRIYFSRIFFISEEIFSVSDVTTWSAWTLYYFSEWIKVYIWKRGSFSKRLKYFVVSRFSKDEKESLFVEIEERFFSVKNWMEAISFLQNWIVESYISSLLEKWLYKDAFLISRSSAISARDVEPALLLNDEERNDCMIFSCEIFFLLITFCLKLPFVSLLQINKFFNMKDLF